MYPLLEIKTVPIEIQVRTKNASLEYTRGTAEMEISRSENGVDVKSRPIRLRLDSYEGSGERMPATQDVQASYEATAAYTQHGQLTLDARVGQTFTQMAQGEAASGQMAEGQQAAPTQWDENAVQIRYEMDKLNFDWKIENGEFEFTPGDIEISVEQRPDITIKYTGKPIYVPKSSDPNYRPVDVHA